jgi:drug/metabolite transporter (DMT)-like permease
MSPTQDTPNTKTNRPLRGIVYKLLSVLIFVVMASLIKATATEVPAWQAAFFRSLFAMPVILVWLAARRELRKGIATKNPWGHVLRGVIGTSAMVLGFAGLGLLPLPEVKALGYTAPLLAVVFASLFLGERIRGFRISMVLLGIFGVMVILFPRLTLIHKGVLDPSEALGLLFVLSGAILVAVVQVMIRNLTRTETTTAIVFYFSISATILTLFTLPFGWTLPPLSAFVLLVLAGILGGVAQIFLTSSYREADVSIVAPFEYISIILAIAIGYSFFGEIPTTSMLTGAALIVVAGLLIIWRERRLGIERSKQRKAMTYQA